MAHTLIPENWNYTYYEHADLKALVSIAHDYDASGAESSYYLTSVIDGENNDLYQVHIFHFYLLTFFPKQDYNSHRQ